MTLGWVIVQSISYIQVEKDLETLLALISADLVGVDKNTANYAAVCGEFIHNASLIHDDLQDKDLLRRGLPTIWNRFGDHTAINLGDYFIAGSFEALAKINETTL